MTVYLHSGKRRWYPSILHSKYHYGVGSQEEYYIQQGRDYQTQGNNGKRSMNSCNLA